MPLPGEREAIEITSSTEHSVGLIIEGHGPAADLKYRRHMYGKYRNDHLHRRSLARIGTGEQPFEKARFALDACD
jgi:hypothetical protein